MTDTQILIANYQSIIKVLSGQIRVLEGLNKELAADLHHQDRRLDCLPLEDIATIYDVFNALSKRPYAEINSFLGSRTIAKMYELHGVFKSDLIDAGILEDREE